MVNVFTEIIIRRTVEKVSEYAAIPDNAPEWYVNIHSAEWQTEKPLTIGSRIAFKAQFLGRELEYVYEIVEYKLHQKLIMRTADGPFPMETTYTWEAIDGNRTRNDFTEQRESNRLFKDICSDYVHDDEKSKQERPEKN